MTFRKKLIKKSRTLTLLQMIHKNKSIKKLKMLKPKLRRNFKPLKSGLMKMKQFLKTRLIHGSTICPIMSSRLSNRSRTKNQHHDAWLPKTINLGSTMKASLGIQLLTHLRKKLSFRMSKRIRLTTTLVRIEGTTLARTATPLAKVEREDIKRERSLAKIGSL